MPVTRSTEIRDTTLNPTVTTDRGCTTGHNHTLSLSLPWAGTWHLQCSKLGVSTQSKGQISHLRARNVHRHECVTLAEFTEAPLLHVWRQEQPSPYAMPLAWQAVRLLASVYCQATADGIDPILTGKQPAFLVPSVTHVCFRWTSDMVDQISSPKAKPVS